MEAKPDAIPVDARLLSMGFKMASKCSCCENPEAETIDHLFVCSETASRIWRYFADIFKLPGPMTTVDQVAQVWLNNISLSSPFGICRNIIFGHILWEIWKQRNEIVFGNGKRNSGLIIARVSATVQHIIGAFNLSLEEGNLLSRFSGGQTSGDSDRGRLTGTAANEQQPANNMRVSTAASGQQTGTASVGGPQQQSDLYSRRTPEVRLGGGLHQQAVSNRRPYPAGGLQQQAVYFRRPYPAGGLQQQAVSSYCQPGIQQLILTRGAAAVLPSVASHGADRDRTLPSPKLPTAQLQRRVLLLQSR